MSCQSAMLATRRGIARTYQGAGEIDAGSAGVGIVEPVRAGENEQAVVVVVHGGGVQSGDGDGGGGDGGDVEVVVDVVVNRERDDDVTHANGEI